MRTALTFTGVSLALVAGFVIFLVWAPMWSERFLAPVQVGMSKQQVRGLVGEPPVLRTNAAGDETWDYSRFWSSEARVHFDTNGVVYTIETD
jgi:outer membrane protein assembly factor BamE (lipoprotein component of BamABCDE complex)